MKRKPPTEQACSCCRMRRVIVFRNEYRIETIHKVFENIPVQLCRSCASAYIHGLSGHLDKDQLKNHVFQMAGRGNATFNPAKN